jgi:hypothetical protein
VLPGTIFISLSTAVAEIGIKQKASSAISQRFN